MELKQVVLPGLKQILRKHHECPRGTVIFRNDELAFGQKAYSVCEYVKILSQAIDLVELRLCLQKIYTYQIHLVIVARWLLIGFYEISLRTELNLKILSDVDTWLWQSIRDREICRALFDFSARCLLYLLISEALFIITTYYLLRSIIPEIF